MAIGAPVAAVTSLVIGAFILDALGARDVAGGILRASVSTAVSAGPLVALVSALWVLAVRRLHPVPLPPDGPTGGSPDGPPAGPPASRPTD